jgi:hypothetical protein
MALGKQFLPWSFTLKRGIYSFFETLYLGVDEVVL